jgi:hypothetical protein
MLTDFFIRKSAIVFNNFCLEDVHSTKSTLKSLPLFSHFLIFRFYLTPSPFFRCVEVGDDDDDGDTVSGLPQLFIIKVD